MADETLSELFARDPFTLTRENIDTIIEAYREKRKTFMTTGKAEKAEKKPVDLADLGLV